MYKNIQLSPSNQYDYKFVLKLIKTMFLSTDSGLITLNTSNLINVYVCKDSELGPNHPCITCVFENKEIQIPMPDFKTAQEKLKEFVTLLCGPELKFQQPFQPF